MILGDLYGGDHVVINDDLLVQAGPTNETTPPEFANSNSYFQLSVLRDDPEYPGGYFYLYDTIDQFALKLDNSIYGNVYIRLSIPGMQPSNVLLFPTEQIALVRVDDGHTVVYLRDGQKVTVAETVDEVWAAITS